MTRGWKLNAACESTTSCHHKADFASASQVRGPTVARRQLYPFCCRSVQFGRLRYNETLMKPTLPSLRE